MFLNFQISIQYIFFWLKQRYMLNKYASAIVQIVRTHTYRQTFFFEKGFLPKAVRFRLIQQQQCGSDTISTHLHTHIKRIFFLQCFWGHKKICDAKQKNSRKKTIKQGCVTNTTTIYMFFLCLTILQDSYAYALLLVASVLFVLFCYILKFHIYKREFCFLRYLLSTFTLRLIRFQSFCFIVCFLLAVLLGWDFSLYHFFLWGGFLV